MRLWDSIGGRTPYTRMAPGLGEKINPSKSHMLGAVMAVGWAGGLQLTRGLQLDPRGRLACFAATRPRYADSARALRRAAQGRDLTARHRRNRWLGLLERLAARELEQLALAGEVRRCAQRL
jgi:hypothetical protein